nr:PREDICTED: aromatic-L-amino-acid decarboxylase isoform X2 [Bemisia tabaci]
METNELRKYGRATLDYLADYLENIKDRRVTPVVSPGWLKHQIPSEAPLEPESFDDILKDVEEKIMPGVTHWQHPRFHAYFPSGASFPAIMADILSDGIGCIGFSWAASPACTELESIVMDWYGKAIGLPYEFLANPAFKNANQMENGVSDATVPSVNSTSVGGGVIQGSTSEIVLTTMISARAHAIKNLKAQHPFIDEGVLLSKLIAYCSREAHSCVEKGAMMAFVKLKIVEPDEHNSLRGAALREVMMQDQAMGMIPFYVAATLGTTSVCSFDNVEEIGLVCREFPTVWLHIDAAYAGAAFVCPEFRSYLKGVQFADSISTNTNKWLLTCFDCSCLWVKNRYKLTSALVVNPVYLKHGFEGAIDYRHWQIPLSRRFRSLKLWFVLRTYGISGLQKYIRHHCELAKRFEKLVLADSRFEISNEVKLGLVCFRLVGNQGMTIEAVNKMNQKLLEAINDSGKLHMVPSKVNDKFIIRFCVVAHDQTQDDIDYAWEIIKEYGERTLKESLIQEEIVSDEVSEMVKRKKDLAYKRSFFVRMVSDPKIYNPTMAHPTSSRFSNRFSASEIDDIIEDEPSEEPTTPTFRHLDTTVHLKPHRDGHTRALPPAESTSPRRDRSKSPKVSPTEKQNHLVEKKETPRKKSNEGIN